MTDSGRQAEQDVTLWTLTKNGHRLEAVQVIVEVLDRVELRISVDGRLIYSRVHRTMGDLLDEAREKRAEAEAKEWATLEAR